MGMKERADGIYSNSLKFFAPFSQSRIRFSSNKRKQEKKKQNRTFPRAARVKSKPISVGFSRLWDRLKPGLIFFFSISALVTSCSHL